MRTCVSGHSLGPANLDEQVFLLGRRNVVEESEIQEAWPDGRRVGNRFLSFQNLVLMESAGKTISMSQYQ